jgi:hypothetical protein
MKKTINRLPGTTALLAGLCFYSLAAYARTQPGPAVLKKGVLEYD